MRLSYFIFPISLFPLTTAGRDESRPMLERLIL